MRGKGKKRKVRNRLYERGLRGRKRGSKWMLLRGEKGIRYREGRKEERKKRDNRKKFDGR